MMNQNYTPQQHQAIMAQMAQQQQQQYHQQQQQYTMMQTPTPMPQSAQRTLSFHNSQFIPAPQMANLSSPSHPPPAKRPRPTPPANVQNVSANAVPTMQDSIEEEEDTSHGDILDHLTPREISEQRYIQHDKWMEEVLGSVFHVNEILPGRLGIETLAGDLKSVMASVYDAEGKPLDDKSRDEAAHLVGIRAKAKTLELERDMEKMKRKHQRELAKIKKGSILMRAERELRSAGVVDLVSIFGLPSDDIHPDTLAHEMGHSNATKNHSTKSVEEIVSNIEKEYKVVIQEVQMVHQINPDGTEMDPIDDNEMTGITATSTSPDGGRVVVPIIKADEHRDTPMMDVNTIPIAAPPVPMLNDDTTAAKPTALLPASPLPSPLPATATPETHHNNNNLQNIAVTSNIVTTTTSLDEPPTVPDEELVPEGFTGGEDDMLGDNAREAFDLLLNTQSSGAGSPLIEQA